MATPDQIAANRANSQKSTGPKTEAGKKKSSANSLSHGLASSAALMPGEDPEEFNALLDDLAAQHQPANLTEQILVEKMALNQWLSLRAFRLQGFAFLGESMKGDNFAIPKDLGLLIRYHTTAERAFHRAHNELVKAQKERRKSEIGFDPQNASARTKAQPISVPITWVGPDFPPDTATPHPHTAPQAVPHHPEFAKTAS